MIEELQKSAGEEFKQAQELLKNRLSAAGACNTLEEAEQVEAICASMLNACVQASLATVLSTLRENNENKTYAPINDSQ